MMGQMNSDLQFSHDLLYNWYSKEVVKKQFYILCKNVQYLSRDGIRNIVYKDSD